MYFFSLIPNKDTFLRDTSTDKALVFFSRFERDNIKIWNMRNSSSFIQVDANTMSVYKVYWIAFFFFFSFLSFRTDLCKIGHGRIVIKHIRQKHSGRREQIDLVLTMLHTSHEISVVSVQK